MSTRQLSGSGAQSYIRDVKVLLVDGFADGSDIVASAHERLVVNGNEVTDLRLIDSGFDRFMTADERRAYHQPDNLVSDEQRRSADQIRSHDGLLVCGPMVEGTIAPCIKGWFERVFIPEVAFTFTKSGRVTGALKNVKRIGMIVSCPTGGRSAHPRRGSTRSVIRAVRLNASRTCRTTYLAVSPTDDVDARVGKALARW